MTELGYKEYVLPSSVDDYIKEQLDYPRALAKILLIERDISRASKTTFLPSNINVGAIADFEVFTLDINTRICVNWLIDKIQKFLKEEESRIVVLQDPCAEKSFPYVKRLDIPITTYQEEVYFVIGPKKADDLAYIEKVLRRADSYYFVGIMSSLPSDCLPPPKEFDQDIINLLVKRTKHLFVQAYDDLGYILCSFE